MTIDWAVREHTGPVAQLIARALDAHPIAWFGRLSYSLYLWQQVFVNREGTHWIQGWPYNLLAAFVLALVSYTSSSSRFCGSVNVGSSRVRFAPSKRLAEKMARALVLTLRLVCASLRRHRAAL